MNETTPDFGGHKVEGKKTGTSTGWVFFFHFLCSFFCLRGENPHILVMGLMEMETVIFWGHNAKGNGNRSF